MVENVNWYAHEILEQVDKAASKKEKIDILQKNDTMVLKNILFGTFDESIEWDLPKDAPPYRACEIYDAPSSLQHQLSNFSYFIKGGKGKDLLKTKREEMFIRMLESIHPDDAKVVLWMIARKLPIKGLTKALVKEAFPTLLS